jgi:hypothetical protein
MATKKIKRFQEGGMSDKDRGLEASKDDKVGFFERLRMGNIDEEGSEAYNRFGAGRAKADRDMESEAAAMRAVDKSRASAAAPTAPAAPAAMSERDEMEEANAREPIPVPAGPRAEQPKPGSKPRVNVQAAKPSAPAKSSPKMQEQTYRRTSGDTGKREPAYTRKGGATADELANYKPPAKNQSLASQIPGGSSTGPVSGKKVEPMSDAERNISNMLAATGVGAGAAGLLYKGKKMLNARKAAQAGAKKRANLKRDVEEGIERNLADEFQNLSSSAAAKKTAGGKKTSDYRSLAGSAREDAKANQAYDKLKKLSSRGAGKASSKKTKKFDDESNIEFKRGGSISGASKRADGIATKGKTRCKMR